MMTPEEALKKYFGFDNFRPTQDKIVQSVLSRKDTLVIMPTGGGKSLCYQLPALLLEGVCLVISPLIALMKDQVDALRGKGIQAAAINSSLSREEYNWQMNEITQGKCKLVYVAPERFRDRRFVDTLSQIKISFIAVDEAHCVSQWGHDFRPDYLRIGQTLQNIGRPPVAAFTATATPIVKDDIQKHLSMAKPESYVTGFERPNLSFKVLNRGKKVDKIAHILTLSKKLHNGIIYCATRKRVDEVSTELLEHGIKSIAYHGGMDEEQRNRVQDEFISGRVNIAVATNAFGMGIDRSDIRFVCHYEMPGSIEAYYQEAGRAGRDGLPGNCDLLFGHADRRIQEFFIAGSNPGFQLIYDLYQFLLNEADEKHEIHCTIKYMADMLEMKNEMAVSTALGLLVRHQYVERFDISGQRARSTRLLKPKVLAKDLDLDKAAIQLKEDRDYEKLQAVVDYAQVHICRQRWIMEYFGDQNTHDCGRCDHCKKNDQSDLRDPTTEELVILQKTLSGVARMSKKHVVNGWEPQYGMGRIVEMLTGSQKQELKDWKLDRLSTYGLLKNEGSSYVKELLEECLRMGMLRRTGGNRPLITLTPLGESAMKAKTLVRIQWPEVKKTLARKKKTKDLKLEYNIDEALLEALKKKRLQLSIARSIPPYHIFSNRTLEALSSEKPLTQEDAMNLPGIGKIKARKDLPAFLRIIASYLAKG